MSNTSLIEVLPNLGVVDIAQADRSAHGERCRVGEAPTTAVKLSNLDIQERNQHQNRENKNKFIRRKKKLTIGSVQRKRDFSSRRASCALATAAR